VAKREKRFRPDQRPKQAAKPAPRRGLTPAEEAAAAAYEANLAPVRPTATRSTAAPLIGTRAAAAQRLSAELAEELPVVRRDLRRIALTYGAMLALLAIIWFAATSTGLISA